MATSKGRTILLVEDDPRMLRIYSDALGARGHTVISISDPREVGGFLSVATPALILLDIMMPEIDGIELCRRARGIVGSRPPIIFLTALNDVETIRKALAAGGNDYVLKGGSLVGAIERIESWLARSRMAEDGDKKRQVLRSLDDMSAETQT